MANQPVFRADPNAVPQINGWPGVLNSIQKGYQLAQLPQQMKMQQMLQAAQLQKYQAETEGQNLSNQYYGPEAEQRIAASKAASDYQNKQTSRYDETINSALARDRALNANTYASTNLTNEQMLAARTDRQQTADFYKALQSGQSGQGASQPQSGGYYDNAPQQQSPQPQYQPGQGGAMYAPPSQGMGQPAPQQMPQGGPQQGGQTAPSAEMQQTSGDGQVEISPGDPSLYHIDAAYDANPQFKKQFEDRGMTKKTSVQVNPKTGQVMAVTTYPSGRIVATNSDLSSVRAENTTEPGEQAAYTTVQKEYGDSQAMDAQLKQLASAINQPGFDNAVGPVNQWLPQFGLSNSDVSKIYGDFEAASRTLQAKMASTLSTRGATNMGLRLAAQTKPNANDTAPVIRGKMEALNTGNKWTMDYSEAVQRNMLNGMNSLDARKKAQEEVPFDKYMGEMRSYLEEGEAGGKIYDYNSKLPEDKRIDISYKVDKFGNELPYVQAIDSKGNHILIPAGQYVKQAGLK